MTARQRLQEAATTARRVRRAGARGLLRKALAVAAERVDPGGRSELILLDSDVMDSADLRLSVPGPRATDAHGHNPLTIGWVTTPPSPGSGGHTTMFRMIEAFEKAGHHCVLYLFDRNGCDLERYEAIIRACWPGVRAEVKDVDAGILGVDACVATSWQSAHVLASRSPEAIQRFYFIQDYEPFFYARGSMYQLAEDSYRFGFRCIALGDTVAQLLRERLDLDCDVVPFGCDTSVYSFTNSGPRTGVVFYTKPGVPRRGFETGRMALERFHQRHPEQEIHLYGEATPDLRFPVTRHGLLDPQALNALYNATVAGLAMSFTNITLVAEEMLAAGNIPVVNEFPGARANLPSPFALWSPPGPGALADALSRAVEHEGIEERAALAARSVRSGWSAAQDAIVDLVEKRVRGVAASAGGVAD